MKNTDKTTSITLAHINDTHSYFEPTSLQLHLNIDGESLSPFVSAGGFARIATRVAQLRSDAERMQKQFIFVHAGDCFQGTLYFSLFKGKVNVDMLNALNIDAMALGNHELDMGNEPVARFAKRIQFPLLAGNWDLANEGVDKAHTLKDNPQVKAYNTAAQCARWIVKGKGQDSLALFGVSIDKMADIANPDSDTPFLNALEVVQQTVKAIQASGINKIILISHLGYDQDLELAAQVDGIGVIVGGHSHVLQGDFSDLGLGVQDAYGQEVNGTYVVQAGYYALALGHCDIEFNQTGRVVRFQGQNELLLGRRLFLDASMNQAGLDERYLKACDYVNQHPLVSVCKKDPDVHAVLSQKYMPQVREMQQQEVVQIPKPLRHVRIPDEHGPSQVAPLVARGFYESMRKRGYPVQFAIHNAGGVRTSIQAGPLTTADIVGQLLPFAIPVGVYQIKGQTIASLLEGAINNATNNGIVGTGSGSYPYTHNLKFEYHAHLPKGHRIRQLRIFENGQWQPVDILRNYYGVSSAYTIKGKEGYDAFSELEEPAKMSNLTMADTFVELLTDKPKVIDKTESYNFFNEKE